MAAAGDAWVAEAAALTGDAAEVEAWLPRLPPGYLDRTTPAEFAADLAAVHDLGPGDAPSSVLGGRYNLRLRAAEPGDAAALRLRRAGLDAVVLTEALPLLESFGMAVTEAVPQHVPAAAGRPAVHFDDFGLRPLSPAVTFDVGADGPRLLAAMLAAASGRADVDALNALVVDAGLDWRQVVVLRAFRRFRRQAGSPIPDAALDAALAAWPEVAAGIVATVEARLAGPEAPADPRRVARVAAAEAALAAALAPVDDLSVDAALRGFVAVAEATVRTNWYAASEPDTIVCKIDSARVPELPQPRPHAELFVHGPAVEGVHLRMGAVARGGIRHSDRPADVRTEVLALAEAQTKKNAIIVPTGAKGGFVVRRPGGPPAVLDAYRRYITALLEVTDDVAGGRVVHPEGVVATDGDDPYLVVAADKGTATFSDDANAISAARGFWLGDAFASGGSHGYDHKAMGITARGAWVAVRRHFRRLGIDVQVEPVRVAGVGDMSGDVFGNGMLLSKAVKLVAAFDHRHVFVDPDPDPERSHQARAELAARGRSSWDDYDRSALSAGGGIWSRSTRSVPLSPQARAALGVSAIELSPPEIISAILAAPVDLLFFGGIGTYVKDAGEADADVGDRANDAVRITADRVRARVIAEGGNLGITQRGRIRYSRRGGRVNADFIDNAAGVATSDREVNLKILLRVAAEAGRVDDGARDRLLVEATDEVAAEVLRLVDHSVAALDRSVADSAEHLDAYVALLEHLESVGLVDREVEALPGDEELAARRSAGAGLIRPELAGLLAFAKSDLVRAVVDSPHADEPLFEPLVVAYFPAPLRAVAGDLVRRHRLYRQLAATAAAGALVDTAGPIWATETAAELGRSTAEVVTAWHAARTMSGAAVALATIEGAGHLDADEEASLHARVAAAVGRLARWRLRSGSAAPPTPVPPADHGDPVDAAAAVEARVAALTGAEAVAEGAGLAVAAAAVALEEVDAHPVLTAISGLLEQRPAGRFESWQHRALLDDLDDLRRRLAVDSLRSGGLGRIVGWAAEARGPAARAAAVLDAAGAPAGAGAPTGTAALTVAALALRAAGA